MERNKLKKRRVKRSRAKIFGTALRPRLCVFRSLRYVYAQLIDDERGKIIASFDSRKVKGSGNNVETARKVGREIARMAIAKKIKKAVFDRHGYKYHGKVKAVAEGAREGGLVF